MSRLRWPHGVLTNCDETVAEEGAEGAESAELESIGQSPSMVWNSSLTSNCGTWYIEHFWLKLSAKRLFPQKAFSQRSHPAHKMVQEALDHVASYLRCAEGGKLIAISNRVSEGGPAQEKIRICCTMRRAQRGCGRRVRHRISGLNCVSYIHR